MATTIEQTVDFPGITPERLFDLYMDAGQHKAATGGPVEIEPRPGGKFAALGGLTGRILVVESPRLIVQTWRAKVWQADDPDSVLVLTFATTDTGVRLQLVQANVPDHAYQTIENGWRQHYWTKWAEHLADEG